MIKNYLENHYNIGRLNNSYLITTDDLDKALLELNEFINDNLLKSNAPSYEPKNSNKPDLLSLKDINHPDYICIRKIDNKLKNISVEQIRVMQSFLYKTSVISGKKIAVIYGADEMNHNAANSCLKILEDTPQNAYIFLLTENRANIPDTLLSRCAKINFYYSKLLESVTDVIFIKPLLKATPLINKLEFITKFANKDRDLWAEFSLSLENLMAKFCKKTVGIQVNLSQDELSILAQFKSCSPYYMQRKYDEIKKIIDDTNIFDLDLRSSCLILINKFKN